MFCGKVSRETQYFKLEEVNKIIICDLFSVFKVLFFKIHEDRVMGVGIDPSNNVIFSVGEDKFLKVTDLTNHKIIFGREIITIII